MNIIDITSRAEALGASIEQRIGIPQRQNILIVNKITRTVVTQSQLEDVVTTIESRYILNPKVTEAPQRYLNMVFSESLSALTVNAGDLLVTVPRILEPSEFIASNNITNSNTNSITTVNQASYEFFIGNISSEERLLLINNAENLFLDIKKDLSGNIVSFIIPNNLPEWKFGIYKKYKYIKLLDNKHSTLELLLREYNS